ncbi:hypothetical protein AJ78_04229 [Emergomyces pasteurianus Ep9510]|uniref:Low temperature requirement protein LtrA n=1 Tax=Emergomyces pasteurianus Ep9510 TaxID=1447872 RepID=A0A1J9QJZ3_9EURO|nr:hypothetical protein AJ78_04229 [Emergomyces pasteurianus Ep9510]
MGRPLFLSFTRDALSTSWSTTKGKQRRCVPWIASPLDKTGEEHPRLNHHTDSTSIELFFDLFFVANLSTFTATHEINNLEALWSYVAFLSIIWFTWLQVALFDIRFAQDSIFERICKALQLATMVGFASTGSGFATQVRDENVWAFRSLSMLLACSRLLLSIEYSIAAIFLYRTMKLASKRLLLIVLAFIGTGVTYTGLYFLFNHNTDARGEYLWTSWFVIFAIETLVVMSVSSRTPGIGFEDTHLNVRMGLLTLIIIGEGVISVTRIVNQTVGSSGWTKWSFVHILGVTTGVYLLWQSYFDLSPRIKYGPTNQQIWTQLHFPFHVVLVLLSEGSQILALTLDISLKLKYLSNTISFACESSSLDPSFAVDLLNSTIMDMDIDYNKGTLLEQRCIQSMLQALRDSPRLCPSINGPGSLTLQLSHDLMGNVTASLFSSMGITLPVDVVESEKLLMLYLRLLGFVYIYYFFVASFAMFILAAFVFLTQRHTGKIYIWVAITARVLLGIILLCMITMVANFRLVYSFMTSPLIIFSFTLALLVALLVDRILDSTALKIAKPSNDGETTGMDQYSMFQLSPMATAISNDSTLDC